MRAGRIFRSRSHVGGVVGEVIGHASSRFSITNATVTFTTGACIHGGRSVTVGGVAVGRSMANLRVAIRRGVRAVERVRLRTVSRAGSGEDRETAPGSAAMVHPVVPLVVVGG